MITKSGLANFKCFRAFEIEPGLITVLNGPNGFRNVGGLPSLGAFETIGRSEEASRLRRAVIRDSSRRLSVLWCWPRVRWTPLVGQSWRVLSSPNAEPSNPSLYVSTLGSNAPPTALLLDENAEPYHSITGDDSSSLQLDTAIPSNESNTAETSRITLTAAE